MGVSHPAPGVLVLSDGRAGALLRLLIWIAVVGAFFVALPAAGASPSPWLALLVALVLSPYLVDAVGVLVHGRVHTFDGPRRELRATGRPPIAFARIRQLEVAAVNGTCEESRLTVRLDDGSTLSVLTADSFSATLALAREAAALADVPVRARGVAAGPRLLGG